MKKVFLAVVAAVLMFSCGKEDPAAGINVEQAFANKATIEGFAYMNAVDGEVFVPKGTELVFSIPNGVGGYGITNAAGNYTQSTTVGENGAYSISLPAKADGTTVMATVKSSDVLAEINQEGQINTYKFTLIPITQAIAKGLKYQLRLDFEQDSTPVVETNKWEEGTYNVDLKYNNGKEVVAVPAKTKVQITIAGTSFVPAKANAEVFEVEVGDAGKLTIKISAKSLLEGGLPMTLKASFIAEQFTITNGEETKVKAKFDLPATTGVVYGGATNNATPITITTGTPLEQLDPLSTWKVAKYTVNLRYEPNLTSTSLSVLPADAKITVTTTNRNVLAPGAGELIQVYKVSDLADGITFLAPDPALSTTALKFIIGVNFIADITVNTAGDVKKYKYDAPNVTENSLWGGINKDGSTNSENTITVSRNSGSAIN